MLSLTQTKRICAATLAGRFGMHLIPASEMSESDDRQATAAIVLSPRTKAVQSMAHRGHEQGIF